MNPRSHTNLSHSHPQPSAKVLDTLVDRWNAEHAEVTQENQQLHRWLTEIRHHGVSGHGELATRLQDFRQQLLRHFEREEEIGMHLQEACDWVEMAASRRQITNDHQHLTKRIDALIEKLSQPDPPFDSLAQAVDEVGLFVDAFELHEEQETQCLQWLTARPLDFRKVPR